MIKLTCHLLLKTNKRLFDAIMEAQVVVNERKTTYLVQRNMHLFLLISH